MSNCSTNLYTGYHGFGTPITSPFHGNSIHRASKTVAVRALTLLKTIVPPTGTFCDRLSHRLTTYRSDLEFQATVQPPAGSPKLGEFSSANVLVVPSMNESLEWKKSLIRSATTSIEWSFNYAGGERFREVLTLIQKQMTDNPNLRVHLLLSEDCLEEADLNLLRELSKNKRFAYLITGPHTKTRPFIHLQENHVKLLCVDGKYFAMGGSGVTDKMTDNPIPPREGETARARLMAPAIRDTDLIGEGIVTQTMRRQFFSLFGKWEQLLTGVYKDRYFITEPCHQKTCQEFDENKKVLKGVQIKYIVGGPEHHSCNPIIYEISSCIYKAKKHIRIANFILNPPHPICTALRFRQKSLQIIGQTLGCTTNRTICFLWHAFLNRNKTQLFDGIFEFNKEGVMYHKKIAVIDNETTVIGSFNLGYKSAYCDDENICIINDARVAEAVNASLEADLEDSIPVNPHSLSVRLCGFIGQIIRHTCATLNG